MIPSDERSEAVQREQEGRLRAILLQQIEMAHQRSLQTQHPMEQFQQGLLLRDLMQYWMSIR